MIIAYFILAHLLGDFVFQPTSLVKWKMKSFKGTIVHAAVHFIITCLVLLPFILNGYSWLIFVAALIGFVHFLIDEAKINYDLRHDEKAKPFIIDQLLHLLTLLIVFYFTVDINFQLPGVNGYEVIYGDIRIVMFIAFLIFISTSIEIYHFQKIRERNKKATLKLNANQILNRIIIFTLVYAVFMFIASYRFL